MKRLVDLLFVAALLAGCNDNPGLVGVYTPQGCNDTHPCMKGMCAADGLCYVADPKPVPAAKSILKVDRAPDGPMPHEVADYSQDVVVIKFTTAADASADAPINSFTLQQIGLGNNSGISNIELWGGDGLGIGKRTTIDPMTGKFTFDGLGAVQKAGTIGSWAVFISFKGASGNYKFSLIDATLADGGTVKGVPLEGPGFTITNSRCFGSPLLVPYDCPNIQAAVNVAIPQKGPNRAPLTQILIAGGTYQENVSVPSAVSISLAPLDQTRVTIDGGNKPAVYTQSMGGTQLSISGITLVSNQKVVDYRSATLLIEFCELADINDVIIYSTSIDITLNYVSDGQIMRSLIGGNGKPGTTGINWYHISEFSRLFWNTIRDVDVGIRHCTGNEPLFSPLGNGDNSNSGQNIGQWHIVEPNCP